MMKITATCVSILSLSSLMGTLAPCSAAALDSKITKHLSDSGAVVTIESDRDTYSPVMSSTVGIGMTPKIISTTKAANVRFHWQTTHGTFVVWGSPGTENSKVRELEAIPTTKNGEKIYWSFAIAPTAAGGSKALPNATVSVTAKDVVTGNILGRGHLVIDFSDSMTAHVRAVSGRTEE